MVFLLLMFSKIELRDYWAGSMNLVNSTQLDKNVPDYVKKHNIYDKS